MGARVLVGGATAVLAVVAAIQLWPGARSEEAQVRIEPVDALLDAPLRLEIRGLEARSAARLGLSATALDGVHWTGSRLVSADDSGAVSIDGGSLLAALHPTGPQADAADIGLVPPSSGLELQLDVRQGDHIVGSATALRRLVDAGVSRRDLTVARDGFAARLWSGPAGERRSVAVLSLGGSGGGFSGDWIAELLASHGYPVLQLAYFREDGLPGELRDIRLEYFGRALEWLRRRSGVDPKSIVVEGRSRGAELALILGSRFPELIGGVVAYAPSNVVNPALDGVSPAWTLDGKPLLSPTSLDREIRVERILGPVLTVAGGADEVWGAAYASSAIVARRRAHGRTDTEEVVFDDAGHGVAAAIPYLPLWTEFPSGAFTLVSGGSRQADALARTASWPRLIALLESVSRASG